VIGGRFAITSAHCFFGDGHPEPPFDVEIGGETRSCIEVRLNECYEGEGGTPNSADVAILVFDGEVHASATPYDIYDPDVDGEEVGKTITIIGVGAYGPMGSPDDGSLPSGVFHRGENIIDKQHYNMLIVTMDEGSDGLALEAIGNSGDSGSPGLINVGGTDKIAGILSNGSCCDYGDELEFTRVGSKFAKEWITANIADYNLNGGVAVADCKLWEGAGYLVLGQAFLALLALTTF